MPWLVKEDIQRGLFHKEPEIPIIQNSFQMLQQVCLRFYCQSWLDSRSSRIDFNLELNNVTNTYKHKCYLHSLVSKVELGNRDQLSLARAVHCSEVE